MSLTSLLKGKSEHAKELQTVLRDIIPNKDEFVTLSEHHPFSSYTSRVPYHLTKTYYSAVIGTAFDYMARLIIAQKVSINSEEVWVDSASDKGLRIVLRRLPHKLRFKLMKKYEAGQMIAKEFVIEKNELSDELLNHSAYLAKLEHVSRSGMPPKNIEVSLLSDEVDEIIQELSALCDVFINKFIIPEVIASESDVVFNPHFGNASKSCGGADADIYIDGTLYDFKSSKSTGYKWQEIAQIFGYYFLNEIAKKTNDPHAPLLNKEIKRLAFYKARYGEFEIIHLASMDQMTLKQTRDKVAMVLNIDLANGKSPRYTKKPILEKPFIKNKKDVIHLENNLARMQIELEPYSDNNFNQKIKKKWENLKEHTALENLKTMPIDTISTLAKGMPINALMNQGVRTIYDVRDKNEYELQLLNGVGTKSAEAIYDAVSKIKHSVYQQATPRINPDQLSDEDIDVLEAIYEKWELKKQVKVLQSELNLFIKKIDVNIETAKEQRGFLGSLFQPKRKKSQINAAFAELNQLENIQNLEEINRKLTHIHKYQADREELIQHFIAKNISYYTEIEKVTQVKQEKMAESLPTEIVDAVNQFPLDTTNLKVDLRQYQAFGAKYSLYFKRTLLGDEMGLGKTIQAIAMINHLFQQDQKYTVVVCPLSILANWKREIGQHSNLNAFIYHGANRDHEFSNWQKQTGILLTTYEHTLMLDRNDLKVLDILIVDEAHYVKKPDAKRSKSVYDLANIAEYVLFMSGTPLENRLEEMKQLIAVLQEPIANQLSQELHLLQPNEFKKTVAPVYLRRNRKDVLAELPELEIIPQWLDFGKEERVYYQQAVEIEHLMRMRRAAWVGGSPEKSPKLEMLLTICEEAAENGHKVLVFSFFRDVITTIQQHLTGRTFEPITGDVSPEQRQEIIDQYTQAKPGSVLISQITAGGVGLNIQAANIVILCEPQWKPSTEEQAISRAYRMGQSRNVVVYRLLTEDSIDVSMMEVLGEKANLFDLYARESQVAAVSLSLEKKNGEESLQQQVLEMEKQRLNKRVG